LARRSVPRDRLRADGYRPVAASTALHRHGYQVRYWWKVSTGHIVIELHPRWKRSQLPRVTVDRYADQAALHRALGLNLVPPGEEWQDYGGRGLFDDWCEREACMIAPALDNPAERP
jgi:hypothetical protein